MKKMQIIFKFFICSCIIYCLIFEFDFIKPEIIKAITIWISVIIPAVFPYLVLSDYITKSDIMKIFEKTIGRVLCNILKLKSCCTRTLVCSFLCGYPSGAVSAVSLESMGYIGKAEAKRLICFTNNAGPLFLICAVGSSMLGCARDGFAIYLIQLLSALIYGFISSRYVHPINSSNIITVTPKPDLCESVNKAVITSVNICGFMITAYTLSSCLIIFIKYLNLPQQINKDIIAFIKSFFEISSGVSALAKSNCEPINFAFICSAVSWSGLSVIMQIISVSNGIAEYKSLIFAKAVQSLTSFAFGYAYKQFTDDIILNFNRGYFFEISILFSVVLFIITRKPLRKI